MNTPIPIPSIITRRQKLLQLAQTIAAAHEITLEEILGPDRRRKYCDPRQLLYYLSCQFSGAKDNELWAVFGHVRCSIRQGERATKNRAATEPAFAEELAAWIPVAREIFSETGQTTAPIPKQNAA